MILLDLPAAFLIRAKVGMQQLWQMGYDWDQELPSKVCQEWIKLLNSWRGLNDVTFPRCITPTSAIGLPMLCIFADASREAFGACAYVRWKISNGEYDVRFMAAKSRVAPLKELTIPRLELQAAVLATRLYKTLQAECRLQFEKAILFTERRNVRVDDIVMVADQNAVRGQWCIGRILQVYPGSDGRIRNVKVRNHQGEYRRPITKIAVIYPAEGFEDDAIIGVEDV